MSGCGAVCCDKHQFYAKIMVSTVIVDGLKRENKKVANKLCIWLCSARLLGNYRPFLGGVASRLATAICVTMVTPIFYDNSYSRNDSNVEVISLNYG